MFVGFCGNCLFNMFSLFVSDVGVGVCYFVLMFYVCVRVFVYSFGCLLCASVHFFCICFFRTRLSSLVVVACVSMCSCNIVCVRICLFRMSCVLYVCFCNFV